jgi:hypothetical protein
VGLGATVTILADLFLLEVADIAGGFEESAGVPRDVREVGTLFQFFLGLRSSTGIIAR